MADQSIYDLFQECTVRIKTSEEQGTGFFAAPNKILTCKHVLKKKEGKYAEKDEIEVYWKEKLLELKEVEKAEDFDLALLKVNSEDHHPCVYLDRETQPNDELYSYGYPREFEKGFSVVPSYSGLATKGKEVLFNIKGDSIREGLSGAPLLNQRTLKVCGLIKEARRKIIVPGPPSQVVWGLGGLAIPTKVVFDLWKSLEGAHDEFHDRDTRWRSLIPRVIGKLTFEGLTLTFLSRLGIRVDASVLDKQFSEPVPFSTPPQAPKPSQRVMGYKNELNEAIEALKVVNEKKITGFYGEPESEKWLLEKIGNALVADFPDGVVYLEEGYRYLNASDLLEHIFYKYYEKKDGIKYGVEKIVDNLKNRRLLLLVHDTKLSSQQVEKLCNKMRESGFVFTWRKGNPDPLASAAQSIFKVGRLEHDDALDVVAEEFIRGRAKTPDEKAHLESGRQWRELLNGEDRLAAKALLELEHPDGNLLINGHPAKIRRAVILAKDTNRSLQEIVEAIRNDPSLVSLTPEKAESLSEPNRRILKLLAVLGVAGIPLLITLFRANAAEIPNIGKHLNSLVEQGLVQASDSQYQLTSDISEVLNQATDLTDLREEALNHFTTLVEQQIEPDQVFENVDAISNILEWAVESGRWTEVIKLGQGLEGALVFNGLWGLWERVLQWELQASQALNDGQSASWALHQLGTRALSLGDSSTARSRLTQALTLRESLGDTDGAAVTRHNLGLLAPLPLISHIAPPITVGATAALLLLSFWLIPDPCPRSSTIWHLPELNWLSSWLRFSESCRETALRVPSKPIPPKPIPINPIPCVIQGSKTTVTRAGSNFSGEIPYLLKGKPAIASVEGTKAASGWLSMKSTKTGLGECFITLDGEEIQLGEAEGPAIVGGASADELLIDPETRKVKPDKLTA